MSSYNANNEVRRNQFRLIPPDMDTNPFRLVLEDIGSVFRLSKLLILIVTPHSPCPSGALDELYPNCPNLRDILLHILLIIIQVLLIVTFLIFLLTFWVFPVIVPVVFSAFFWVATMVIKRLLNGPPMARCLVGVPNNNIPPVNGPDEPWFFINGIATGRTWLQSNLDLLANIFRREIVGIHNPTKGLILDLVECLIQRDLDYKTKDIRQGRAQLRNALHSHETKRVILLAHSQGGIEASSIIDWLYGECSNDTMRKLEVYTFGNAARHMRNPVIRLGDSHPDQGRNQTKSIYKDRVIKYIEHYANTDDFVANIGVLKFTSQPAKYYTSDLFSGSVFTRKGSGHLLNLHYLDTIFDEQGQFMNYQVPVPEQDASNRITLKTIGQMSRLFGYKDGRYPEDKHPDKFP